MPEQFTELCIQVLPSRERDREREREGREGGKGVNIKKLPSVFSACIFSFRCVSWKILRCLSSICWYFSFIPLTWKGASHMLLVKTRKELSVGSAQSWHEYAAEVSSWILVDNTALQHCCSLVRTHMMRQKRLNHLNQGDFSLTSST